MVGLPLSLLEVYTIAHVLCTLGFYLVWWHKPLDIKEPTFIRGERAREGVRAHAIMERVGFFRSHQYACGTLPQQRNLHSKPDCIFRTSSGRRRDDADRLERRQSQLALAMKAYRRYGITPNQFHQNTSLPSGQYYATFVSWKRPFISSVQKPAYDGESVLNPLMSMCISVVFGSVHILGWNAQFPSPIEQTFWRVATVFLCSWLVVLCVGFSCRIICRTACVICFPSPFSCCFPFSCCLTSVVCCLVGVISHPLLVVPVIAICYILGSAYLLVESLRQLFFLPSQAFELASWSDLIPHLS